MKSTHARSVSRGVATILVAVLLSTGFTIYNLIPHGSDAETTSAEEQVPVTVVPAAMRSLRQVLEQTGDVQPWGMVNIYSKVSGKIIEQILVEQGDTVHQGDPVALLERDLIDAQLAEACAGLAAAEANLGQVEANLKVLAIDRTRMENLLRERAVARQKVDHIQAQYNAMIEQRALARAQIEKSQAVIRQLTVLSTDHTLRAPIDGIVAQRYLDVGNMTAPGVPLFSLVDDRTVKIVTTVAEKDWPAVQKGMAAEVRVDAHPGKVFQGRVALVSPLVDPATRTARVEIHVPNSERRLAGGMFANLRLILGARDALAVPADAIQRLPGTGQPYVYVVADGTAHVRNVVTGMHQGDTVAIESGLTAGERVVVRGQNRLREGRPVILAAPDSAAPATGEPS